jgi:putative SOS response-associated peptidase YedK
MPADEFFERGHYFHLPEFRPFAFAALWERWKGGDGEVVDSCTLLTTEANDIVRSVGHPRMPVMMTSEADYARWLNPELTGRAALEPLFAPLESNRLECYPAAARAE